MKNKKLQHTHRHLTLVFTGVTFCIILIIGSSFLFARYYNELRIQKKDIISQIATISLAVENDRDFLAKYRQRRNIQQLRKFDLQDQNIPERFRSQVSFFVIDADGNLVFQERIQEPNFRNIDFTRSDVYRNNDSFISTRDIAGYTFIFYQNVRYNSDAIFRDFLLLLVLVSIISWGIYFIGYRFVWKALRPVEQNMKDMSDFIHNAGHELKTPLAVIRWNLQIMQAEKKYDAKLLKSSISSIDNANMLIEWLRELSQAGKVSGQEKINLPEFTRVILSEFIPQMQEKNITLELLLPKIFYILVNKQELEIVIKNIVKNAILYNKQGGKVMIKTEKNTLTIIDTGIWIAPENIHKIFDRLYREWEARDASGYGIGLSMVKKIADSNGWKIKVQSEKGNGTRFEIIF